MTSEQTSSYLKFCPNCGVNIPANLKGCWSCGEFLDPHIIELAKATPEEVPNDE